MDSLHSPQPSAAAGELLAGIGFTTALFVADLAFDDAPIGAAKLLIGSASAVSAAAAAPDPSFAPPRRGASRLR